MLGAEVRMRSRLRCAAVGVAMMLVVSSCGFFGGGDDEATEDSTTTAATTATTEAPVTTTDTQVAPGAQEASYLKGESEPPPGLEALLEQTISSQLLCTGTLNGPGGPQVFILPPSTLARVFLGDVLYNSVVERAELDPSIIARLADVSPAIETPDLSRELTGALRSPVVTIDPDVLRSLDVGTFTVDTISPNVFLPGITFAPSVTTSTLALPPPATIREVAQTEAAIFCGTGWGSDRFLQTTITDPAGRAVVERFDQASEGSIGISWTPGLEDPVGRYTVAVTDGSFTAEAMFDVIPPARPTIDVLGSEAVTPGDTVKIGLVAFEPGSTIDLHVFAESDLASWRYTGTAAGVVISELGSTIFELQTLADDPEGVYCILADGAPLFTCRNVAFEVAAL